MKQLILAVALFSALCPALDFAAEAPAKTAAPAAAPQLLVVTSLGNFTMELNPERAPLTVAIF